MHARRDGWQTALAANLLQQPKMIIGDWHDSQGCASVVRNVHCVPRVLSRKIDRE
jgi:hypothetical protein